MSFGIFETKKNTTQNTTNYNDSSANAGGTGSVAVGTGAILSTSSTDASGGGIVTGGGAVNIQTTDAETVGRALQFATSADRETTTRYNNTLETLRTDRTLSSQNLQDVQNAARDAIAASNNLASSLSAQVSDSKKDPNNLTVETLGKYALYGVVAVAVVAALAFALRRRP